MNHLNAHIQINTCTLSKVGFTLTWCLVLEDVGRAEALKNAEIKSGDDEVMDEFQQLTRKGLLVPNEKSVALYFDLHVRIKCFCQIILLLRLPV